MAEQFEFARVKYFAKDLLGKFVVTTKGKVGRVVAHDDGDGLVIQFQKSERVRHLWMMRLYEIKGWSVFDNEADAKAFRQ